MRLELEWEEELGRLLLLCMLGGEKLPDAEFLV
jgi:hypothetical protein